MNKIFCILLFFCAFTAALSAQVTDEQLKIEMEKRGLDEDEVRMKLMERGIDIDEIDPGNPGQVLMVEKALQEIVAEKAAENAAKGEKKEGEEESGNIEEIMKEQTQEEAAESAEEIKEAIEDGATVEEALSEELVEVQTEELPKATVYGQEVFRNKSIRLFRSSEDIKPKDTYILGVGDRLTVSIWGYSEETIPFEINNQGYIKPPEMPRIYLKGMTLGKAKKLLESRFGKYYRFRPQEFEVTLNFARTITVNIVGEVYSYGSFTIPAINTAYNALIAAGGPNGIGSVRKIVLKRVGEPTQMIDVYKFLLDPSAQDSLYLLENDYIFVPIADKIVGISGAVKRPFKYELLDNENLKKLLFYAGGLKDNAHSGNVQIKRFVNNEEIIIDVDYDNLQKTNGDFKLLSGDMISIKSIPKPYRNFVEIEGAVSLPGKYALSDGMRLSDLLKQGVILEESRTDVAFLQRTNLDNTIRYEKLNIKDALENANSPSNIVLQPKDKLIIYEQKRYADNASIKVKGAIRNPATVKFDYAENLKLSDLITIGGGLDRNAAEYAYVKRTDYSNNEIKEYIRINIYEALASPASEDNIALKPFDEVTIFSNENFTEQYSISTNGAVREPGTYEFEPGLRVSDVVYFSKGLKRDATDFAYVFRTDPSNTKEKEYLRVNIKEAVNNPKSDANVPLQPDDVIFVYSNLSYFDKTTIRIDGAVRAAGVYQFDESLSLKDVLTMAGGLKMEAAKSRVEVFRLLIDENKETKSVVARVELDDELNIIDAEDGFKLMPYDQIMVRTAPDFELHKTAYVNGEIRYPGGYVLTSKNETISSLIKRAGNLTEEAFAAGATLLRPKDNVGYIIIDLEKALKKNGSLENMILKDGDVIEIPKIKDFVSIYGATNARDFYQDKITSEGKITVPYHGKRSAKHYVNKYAAGVNKNGRKRLITVEHPNGEIKRTRNFGLFKIYPRVKKGSNVTVGYVPPKVKEEGEAKSNKDWGGILAATVAQVTSVLTLILLVQRID